MGEKGVYLSVDDPRRWSALPLQNERLPGFAPIHRLVGGDRNRLFFVIADTHANESLVRAEADGKTAVLRRLPSDLAAFASKDVGALANESEVFLSTDGGAVWHPGINLGQAERVFDVQWISTSRLLVGLDSGAVQLVERQGDNKFHHVWSTPPAPGAVRFALDGNYVWVVGPTLRRLKLADGKVDVTVKPDIRAKGLAACHDCLVIWAGDAMSVWRRTAGGAYEPRGKMTAPAEVTGVLPLKNPLCLVITRDGKGALLDLDKMSLSPEPLQVTPLPKVAIAVDPNVATPEQLGTMMSLARQVTPAEAEAIAKEALKNKDFTHRQRVEWMTKELQRIIDKHKSAPAK